jgi:hypothetical protein
MSKKQPTVSTSSCEAEYISACFAAKEAVWLRTVLNALNFPKNNPTTILIDNRGARILTKEPSFHARSKHIDVQYHCTRERVEMGDIIFVDVPTKANVADVSQNHSHSPHSLASVKTWGYASVREFHSRRS